MTGAVLPDTTSRNLHVGCGHTRFAGWLNCDMHATESTDLVFDLMQPWPIVAGTQCQIYASHVLEHLPDHYHFFREAWKALVDDGLLYLRVPYGGHPAAWWDPTHLRPWFIENFVYVQPGYGRSIGNPQNEGWQWPFRVEMVDVRVGEDIAKILRWLRFRCLRQRFFPWIRHFAVGIEELFVSLRALKSQEAVQRWIALNHPNVLRCQYVCWKHQYAGRVLPPGTDPELHVLGIGVQLNGYN